MTMKRLFPFWFWALLFTGTMPTYAQISPGTPYSSAVQFFNQNWKVTDGDTQYKISQSVLPLGFFLPFADRLEMRASTSFVHMKSDDSGAQETVSGMTDLKLQLGYALNAERNFVANAAFSLPTGFSELTRKQQDVLADFIAPDLSVRENRFGEGLNVGGTLSYVTDPTPESLIGGSVGVLRRGAFQTTLLSTDQQIELLPGVEAAASVAYSHTTAESFFQFTPTFTIYGDEYVNGAKTLRLGPKAQAQALATRLFANRKAMFTAALQGILRGKTQTFNENVTVYQISNPNSLTLLGSLEYQVVPKVRLVGTFVGRFIRSESDPDAEIVAGTGQSNVFEQGLIANIALSRTASISIGERYISGSGTNRDQETRTISGLETFIRTSIRF